jgi:hypothetical protein
MESNMAVETGTSRRHLIPGSESPTSKLILEIRGGLGPVEPVKRFFQILGFCLSLIGFVSTYIAAPDPEQPNVLFISVDDLNDWVGCLGGNPQSLTPNIDRPAAEGVLLRSAYTADASGKPSRSAIFTGIAPWRSGLHDNRDKIRKLMPDEVLMYRHFPNDGYHSAGSGKLLHYVIDPQSLDDCYPDKETDNPFPPSYDPPNRALSLKRGDPWQYVETGWSALDVDEKTFSGDCPVAEWICKELQKKQEQPFFLACGIYRPPAGRSPITANCPISNGRANGARVCRHTSPPSAPPTPWLAASSMTWRKAPTPTPPSSCYGATMAGTLGKRNTGRSSPRGAHAPACRSSSGCQKACPGFPPEPHPAASATVRSA